MRDSLDRFYTPETTSKYCIDLIYNLDSYDVIVEPSAGAGSFTKNLPGRTLSFDIAPADDSDNIIEKDYLTVQQEDIPCADRMLVIGNPPFGSRSVLAKRFIKKSVSLGADTIAFILPNTFKKYLNQTMFSEEWRLIEISDTPDDFFILNNERIHIPCSFFVWTKVESISPGINLRDKKQPKAPEFDFLPRGDTEADFTINGNTGRVKYPSEVTNTKAEHYIKVSPGYDPEHIKRQMDKIEFNLVSSVNGGVAWAGQNDILCAWNNRK